MPLPYANAMTSRSRFVRRRLSQAVFCAALLFILAMPVAAFAQNPSPGIAVLREKSLALVNKARKARGLPSLTLDKALDAAAEAHADDMLRKHYFAHVAPNGATPEDRYRRAGGAPGKIIRENIARCAGCRAPPDLNAVVVLQREWMNSPEHRANILASGIAEYGFGIAQDRAGNRYAVQFFSGPGVSLGPKPGQAHALGPAGQARLAAALIDRLRGGSAKIASAAALGKAARDSIPSGSLASVNLARIDPLSEATRTRKWRRYKTLIGSCGGCGVRPTDADIRFFFDDWKKKRRYRAILADRSLTALGFALAADGEGAKIAVAILAGN